MNTLLVLLPFLAFVAGWSFNGQAIPLLASSMILLLAWVGLLLWRRSGAGLQLPRGGLTVFMAAWLAWFGLTLFWSGTPYTSWFYFWILGSLPLAFLGWQLMPAPDRAWRAFWPLLMLSALALAGWGIYQYIEAPGSRPKGPLLDWNSYAALLNLLFFPVLARFFLHRQRCSSDWASIGYMVLLTGLLFAFFTTASRGGTLAWLLVLPLAFWSLRRQPAFKSKALAVLGLALLAFVSTSVISDNQLANRLDAQFMEHDRSVGSRFDMWASTLAIFRDHPAGTGLGSYFIYYPEYRAPQERESAGTYAHNDYVQYLQEGGPLNLGFLMAFVLALLWLGRRTLARPEDAKQVEAAGLYLAGIAISAHAVVNFIFYNLPIGLLAGLMIGRAYQMTHPQRFTRPLLAALQVRPMLARSAFALLLAWPAGVLVLDAAVSQFDRADSPFMRLATRYMQMPPELLALKMANALSALRPLSPGPHLYLAEWDVRLLAKAATPVQKKALAEDAQAGYEAAQKGNPRALEPLLAEARLLMAHPDLWPDGQARVETLLNRALKYNPQALEPRMMLAQRYFNRQENDKGYALLRAGLDLPMMNHEMAQLRYNAAEIACDLGLRQDAATLSAALLRELPGNREAIMLARRVSSPKACSKAPASKSPV